MLSDLPPKDLHRIKKEIIRLVGADSLSILVIQCALDMARAREQRKGSAQQQPNKERFGRNKHR